MRIVSLLILIAACSRAAEAKDLSVQAMRSAEGFTWVERASANFDFFVERGTPAARDLDVIVPMVEAHRVAVEKLLGARVRTRIAVFVVPSRGRMKDLTDQEMNGFTYGTEVFVYYQSPSSHALGRHEFCHILALVWKFPKSVGINEGLAVYSDDQWQGQPLHLVSKWLLDRDKLLPLSELLKDGSSLPADADMVTYPELGSFVKFVYETYGRKTVKNLWQRGITDRRVFSGKTLPQVEAEWRAMLAKLDAGAVPYKL